MKEDIFRAKLVADEGIDGLFESVAETSSEIAGELRGEIRSLKAKLAKFEAAYEVYHAFSKMGLELRDDVADATYKAAVKEAKKGENKLAVELLKDASENGCVSARVALAKAQVYGLYGIKRSQKSGLARLREIADEGEPEACLCFTQIHEDYPKLVGPDLALEMCQKAAALDYQPALDRLEEPFDMSNETKRLLALYKKGEKGVAFWLSTRGDLPSSQRADYFYDAVKEGDPMAEYEMGATLLREKDEKGAKEFFEKAVEHGNGPACFALADLILDGKPHYYKGKKLPDPNDPIYQEELRLVKKAAELGDNRGLVVLGRSYVRGYMVEKDYDAAKPLLEKALAQGENDLAPQMLGEIYLNSKEEGSATKAVEYYELSANHGNIASMKALLRIYENGLREVQKDSGKAAYYGFLGSHDRW